MLFDGVPRIYMHLSATCVHRQVCAIHRQQQNILIVLAQRPFFSEASRALKIAMSTPHVFIMKTNKNQNKAYKEINQKLNGKRTENHMDFELTTQKKKK